MRRNSIVVGIIASFTLSVLSLAATPATSTQLVTVTSVYPDLASICLADARLGPLPDGILLRADTVEITAKDVQAAVDEIPAGPVQAEVRKNLFFVLENMAVEKLLLVVARQKTAQTRPGASTQPAEEMIGESLKSVVADIKVQDSEVKAFYEQNRSLFGAAKLDQVKKIIERHLTDQKKQAAIREYVRTLGRRIPIVVSEGWVIQQAVGARDNPIDKARASGKPTLVDFESDECPVCVQMRPLVEKIIKKYQGKANILKINVNEHPVLAARHGVETIPVFVFFNPEGKEVFRHVGAFSEAQFDAKLKEIGVR